MLSVTKHEKVVIFSMVIISGVNHASYQGEGLKTLTPKQMPEIITIALAHVKK